MDGDVQEHGKLASYGAEAFTLSLRPPGTHRYGVRAGHCLLDVQMGGARGAYSVLGMDVGTAGAPPDSFVLLSPRAHLDIEAVRSGWSLQLETRAGWFDTVAALPSLGKGVRRRTILHARDTTMAGIAITFRELRGGRALTGEDPLIETCTRALVMRATMHLARVAEGPRRHAREAKRISRVMDHIEDHLDADLSGEALAAVVGVSPYHFARLFRQETSMSLHQYVTGRKIARATRLLKETDETISQIAYTCGFGSQSHMTQVFSRVVGISPGKLRRERS